MCNMHCVPEYTINSRSFESLLVTSYPLDSFMLTDCSLDSLSLRCYGTGSQQVGPVQLRPQRLTGTSRYNQVQLAVTGLGCTE